ncbi:hypothetical protein V9K67_25905, partial [Paraflavisolibacter sp. H34]|uniref:hypothetical protein n=1 Tax=Huijunlia imazamoxiresistens TaxID=3127457 RepID=UPI00301A56EE
FDDTKIRGVPLPLFPNQVSSYYAKTGPPAVKTLYYSHLQPFLFITSNAVFQQKNSLFHH